MTPDGLPPQHDLSAWHRRFPDHRLWAGRLRLWRVEFAAPATPSPSLLAGWIARATTDGPAAAARRLGLPDGVVAAQTSRPVRQTVAFLDLPTGRRPVPSPATTFDRWPEPVEVPLGDLLRLAKIQSVPVSADWRTVPVVWVEAADVVAVWVGGGIQVFAADAPEAGPLWELPAEAWPVKDS